MRKPASTHQSAYDGGEVLTQFGEPTKNDGTDEIPTRAPGKYATTSNPWPREEEKESMEVARMQKSWLPILSCESAGQSCEVAGEDGAS